MQKTYTTGQVAKICGVAPRTVCKWAERGLLAHYRLPEGGIAGTRRFARDAVLRFMRDQGLPLDGLRATGQYLLLAVTADAQLVSRLAAELGGDSVLAAADLFRAGLLVEAGRPDGVVFDLAVGRSDCLAAARALRAGDRCRAAHLVAVAGEDEPDEAGVLAAGFDDAFRRPFDVSLLAEAIRGGDR